MNLLDEFSLAVSIDSQITSSSLCQLLMTGFGASISWPEIRYSHKVVCSVTDAEAVSMSRYLVHNDGLFLGSSSACNLVTCVKLVRKMGWKDGQTIVTVLQVFPDIQRQKTIPNIRIVSIDVTQGIDITPRWVHSFMLCEKVIHSVFGDSFGKSAQA
jgi:hypothetical protein